eukprot:COSAG01_NODE_61374_length_289_cov_429.373684_1_plen_45_part_10
MSVRGNKCAFSVPEQILRREIPVIGIPVSTTDQGGVTARAPVVCS